VRGEDKGVNNWQSKDGKPLSNRQLIEAQYGRMGRLKRLIDRTPEFPSLFPDQTQSQTLIEI
jgi:hypothetical protein